MLARLSTSFFNRSIDFNVILRSMKRLFLPALLLFPLLSRAAETVTITAEQWARPRTAEAVLAFPGLGPLLEEFERAPDSRIVIRHGGDDEAVLWVEGLRSWLGAPGAAGGGGGGAAG